MNSSLNILYTFIALSFTLLSFNSCVSKEEEPARSSGSSKDNGQANVIFIITDDQGYADLGCYGQVTDIKTPNIDQLAATGVRMTAGYCTSPQCVPSRAGLITGKYQQRFGLEGNNTGPLPLSEKTIADKLKSKGYITGMVGKWHLQPLHVQTKWVDENLKSPKMVNGRVHIPSYLSKQYLPDQRGFIDYFCGPDKDYRANFDLEGNYYGEKKKSFSFKDFRIDLQTKAALEFIKRNKNDPFFLYLAYYGPHVPLDDVPMKYKERFAGPMPERRRAALGLMSAIDDGVGKIMDLLRDNDLEENTLIFFISDNGAPLGIFKKDVDLADKKGVWNGSLNDPFIGEKGDLMEGGIRVPYIVNWKGVIPEGQVVDYPVSTLDATATALKLAGHDILDLDGIDLLPYLSQTDEYPPRWLFWSFRQQEAIRNLSWKYLRLSNGKEFAFNMKNNENELFNRNSSRKDVKKNLSKQLNKWIRSGNRIKRDWNIPLGAEENNKYQHYLKLIKNK